MAGRLGGGCAAISAAMRTVPAESAAISARALSTRHSAGTIRAEVSAKPALSSACKHSSIRLNAPPGNGACAAEGTPWRAAASNTSPQAMFSTGLAHTANATRPPGTSTRRACASASAGRGT
jgi:hypothetical protein